MKRITIIFLVLLGLFLGSCFKTTKPTELDFTEEHYYATGDYTLNLFTLSNEGAYSLVATLIAKKPVAHLMLNSVLYNLYYDGLDEETGYHIHYLDDFVNELMPSVAPGQVMDYSFQMNGLSYSGSIKVPQKANLNLPEFDFDQDYKLTWDISQKPNTYLMSYRFKDYNQNDYSDYVQLCNKCTRYTIPKSGWQSLDPESISYLILHGATNYKKTDYSLAIAMLMQIKLQSNSTATDCPDWDIRDYSRKLFRQIHSGAIPLF